MDNIENTYVDYSVLIKEIGEDKIQERINQIASEMAAFVSSNELGDYVRIDEYALSHAIMDYFSDIQRLKEYQDIEHINDYKIKAYESFWLLQRRPLQIVQTLEDDKWLYVNEKFNLARLASFMLQNNINITLVGKRGKAFKNYMDTLYYYMKFRRCDKQALELMLLSFEAGKLIGGASEPSII